MFFKDRVMVALEAINSHLRGIGLELNGIRHAILRQNKLLQESEKTPKEAAPAPKAITWQEAVNALAMHCCNVPCTKCEAIAWCRDFRQKHPCSWYIPNDKVEVPGDE